MTVWDTVVGQPRVVADLSAAATSPVHAYLLVGMPGAGARTASVAFSAALVCQAGGCGECRDCRLALLGEHPDIEVVEPDKTLVSVELARDLALRAAMSPSEGARRVMILTEFHRVEKAAPALLKTIEEPPATTVFVVLADQVHEDLAPALDRAAEGQAGDLLGIGQQERRARRRERHGVGVRAGQRQAAVPAGGVAAGRAQ